MRFQSILASLAATRLATATDSGSTILTFPEGSGVNGTVVIDAAALARMPDFASYTFPEGSGINGTISVDMRLVHEKMGQVAAATVHGNASNETLTLMVGGPSKDECEECQKLCIFFSALFLLPASVVNCANKGCYPG